MIETCDDTDGAVTDVVTLAKRVAALEHRLAVVEDCLSERGLVPDAHATRDSTPASSDATQPAVRDADVWLPLAGRTLLALGGGFLLRALTESSVLHPLPGALLGMAYAMFWLWLADREGAAGRRSGAMFNSVAAVALLYPLHWESVAHFRALTAVPAAVTLAVTTSLTLLVAWRQRLHLLAWLAGLGATASVLALAYVTRNPPALFATLLWVALLLLGLGYARGFVVLAWLQAALVNFATVVLTLWFLVIVGPGAAEAPPAGLIVALQLALVGVYGGTIAWRTLVARAEISLLEMGQVATAALVGFGGALLVANATGRFDVPLALGGVLAGLLLYGAAFMLIAPRAMSGPSFRFYSAAALALSLSCLLLLLDGAPLTATYCLVGIVLGAAGARWHRVTLSGHAAAYLLAASLAGGMLGTSWHAMTGGVPELASWWGAPLLALVASLVGSYYRVETTRRIWGPLDHLPKLLLLSTAVVGVAGLLATVLLVGASTLFFDAQPPPHVVAALRTAALAGAPLTLALLSRFDRFATARWLIYPILILGAAKLLFEDVRLGTTWSLFFSLLIYGGAVSLTPRLLRRRGALKQ